MVHFAEGIYHRRAELWGKTPAGSDRWLAPPREVERNAFARFAPTHVGQGAQRNEAGRAERRGQRRDLRDGDPSSALSAISCETSERFHAEPLTSTAAQPEPAGEIVEHRRDRMPAAYPARD